MDRANGAGPGSAAAAAAALRAERFEDEKRRIIDSCFSRQDTDGSRKSISNLHTGLKPHSPCLERISEQKDSLQAANVQSLGTTG